MSPHKKISLTTAILINMTIIISAGVFLNVKPLIRIAGPLSPLSYAFSALILLPFVYTLGKLAQAHPVAGGLYVYSKTHINRFAGFLSGWSYFIGKTVSAAFLAHAFTSFFQQNIECLRHIPNTLLTSIVIFSLAFLNMTGVSIGGKIQYFFIGAKAIPIFFTIIFGLTLLQPGSLFNGTHSLLVLTSTIPVAIYAMMGFEITCAIGHMIEKPQKNILRAIIGSFLIVTTLFILFQGILFGALRGAIFNHGQPLALLADKLFAHHPIVGNVMVSLVFASVISGAFGILTSNCWNLHTLAHNNHLPGKKLLTQISAAHVPWVSLLVQCALACVMLTISKNQIALQSMSVFGVVAAFLFSSLAAFLASKHKVEIKIPRIIPGLALCSCAYILFLCFSKMQTAGVSFSYLFVLLSGILFALVKDR